MEEKKVNECVELLKSPEQTANWDLFSKGKLGKRHLFNYVIGTHAICSKKKLKCKVLPRP